MKVPKIVWLTSAPVAPAAALLVSPAGAALLGQDPFQDAARFLEPGPALQFTHHNRGITVQMDSTTTPGSVLRRLRVVDLYPWALPPGDLTDDTAPTRAVLAGGRDELDFELLQVPLADHDWGQTVLELVVPYWKIPPTARVEVYAGTQYLFSAQFQ
jgi:hypothetical protein